MIRRAAVFLALLVFIVHSPRACADPPETNDAIYGHALHGLRIGHDYERCIQQLQYLVAKDPGNRKYHLTLGCADADRASSLGYAVLWTKTLAEARAKYPQDVKDWQAAQRDPTSDNYGDTAPSPPPPDFPIDTKDDNYPFVMPLPKAEARIKTLMQAAQDEWKRALALSRTSADRAETEWTQGKGMQLLRLTATFDLSDDGTSRSAVKDAKPVPTEAMALAALTAATKDAPQNAIYWQSLGDTLFKQPGAIETPDNTKTLAAYNKSLALQPVNAALWFRLYSACYGYRNRQPVPAKAALQHALDSDPDNAYTHYLMAGLIMRDAHYNDVIDKAGTADRDKALHAAYDATQKVTADAALAQMEQGNAAFHYFTPQYVSPCPDTLSAFGIWHKLMSLRDIDFPNYSYMRELARAASGYARVCAVQGSRTDAERASQDVIGMGIKMCGDWPVKDDLETGETVIGPLTGMAITSIGYSNWVKAETDMGNVMAAQQAQAEYDAFKTRTTDYRKTMLDNITNQTTLYDYY